MVAQRLAGARAMVMRSMHDRSPFDKRIGLGASGTCGHHGENDRAIGRWCG